MIDALIRDGATYQAVGDALGMSKARAHALHTTYLGKTAEKRARVRCKVCGRDVSLLPSGQVNRHGNPQCEGSYTRVRGGLASTTS